MSTPRQSRKYKAGDIIFTEGEAGADAFVIMEGDIRLSKSIDGKIKDIDHVQKNGIFGEMALFDVQIRIVTATALTDVECLILDESFLRAELEKSSPIIKALLRVMAKNFRKELENNNVRKV